MFVYKLSDWGFEFRYSHLNFRYHACFEQGVPWHSGNYRVWIHCETRSDMITTYTQMHCADNYSQHGSIIWSVWLNGWVFVYKLSGCGFESHCSHLYSLVYNSFYQKGLLFVYWSSICTFQTIMERSFFKCFFDTYGDSVQNNTTLFKKVSSNFNRKIFYNV